MSLSEKVKTRYRSMYTGVFYKRYILGLWAMAEGIIYDMFDAAKHIVTGRQEAIGSKYVSVDYGTQNATVYLLWEKSRKGQWTATKEYYYSGREEGAQKTDSEYADDMEKFLDGLTVESIIVDPAAASFIAELKKRGLRVKKAKNDVLDGIRFVGNLLNLGLLLFSEDCKETIKEFGSYIWDDKALEHGEDRPVKQYDHCISNKAFVRQDLENMEVLGKEVPLSAVPEWESLEKDSIIKNVEAPLFAYFKIPNANNIDATSPLGASVYSRAVKDIRNADEQWTRLLWEFEGAELAIDADVTLFRKNDTGDFELPTGKERLFRMMDLGDDKDQYKVFSPAIRDANLINGFNAILRRIEFNTGLAYGTLSDPNTVDKTAEEIKASKQRSYSTVSDIQKSLQTALEQLVYAMDVIAQLSSLPGGKKYEVSFDWDDSIVVDKESERKQDLQDISIGVMSLEEYRAKWYGETVEQARANLPEQNQVME